MSQPAPLQLQSQKAGCDQYNSHTHTLLRAAAWSRCVGSVHQDSWGKQGRRVLSTPPPNTLLGPEPADAILALRRCDANNSNSAQKWSLDKDTGRLWTTALSNLPQHSQASSAANGAVGGGGGGGSTGGSTGVVKWCVGGATIPWGRPAGLVPCDDPAYAYNATQDCGPPNVCKQVMSWNANGGGQCIGVPPPTACALPKLGGMAGEGCSLTLQVRTLGEAALPDLALYYTVHVLHVLDGMT